jgi:multidrug efflux pump subunit AcrA (membrane-fusion protein)
MNLLGKIFVVAILVMSVFFMGLSVVVYATHKNWVAAINRPQSDVKPGEPLGLKFQLQEAQAKAKDLEDTLAKLKSSVDSETAARRAQLAKLQSELTDVTKERDQLVINEAGLQQKSRVALEDAQQAQQMLDAKIAEIETLREQLAKAYSDRDQRFDDLVKLTDEYNQAVNDLDRANANTLQLTAHVANYRKAADRKGVDLDAPVDNIPPKLDGIVLASRSDGLIEMSLGADDGLRRGQRAFIYRNHAGSSRFLGVVEVVKTTPDKSVGKVIPEFKKGPIEREDRVATRLN